MEEAQPWRSIYDEYGVDPELPDHDHPVHRLLEETAEQHPDAGVVERSDETSYPELEGRARALAAGLQSHGVEPGDHVATVYPTSTEFLVAAHAVSMAGAVNVPVPVLESDEDVVANLERVEPVAVLGGESYSEAARRYHDETTSNLLVTSGEHGEDTADLGDAEDHRSVDVDPTEDLYAVTFTGGTSGRPKGCMITHSNVVANVRQVEASMSRAATVMRGNSEAVVALPLYHAYGHLLSQMFLGMGVTQLLVTDPRDYDEIERLVDEHDPVTMLGVPTQFHEMKDRDLGLLGISGSAPLKSEVKEEFSGSGGGVSQGYGLSEMSPVTHFDVEGMVEGISGVSRRETEFDVQTIGVPVPETRVALLDPETEERVPVETAVEDEVAAEMLVDGPQRMKGYVDGGDEFHDGYVRTGDVVRIDERGRFYVVDRVKDMINVSGLKVYSEEVEEELERHPAVERAAVVGVPDPDRPGSERVAAYVESTGAIDEEDVRDHLDGRVARQARPREVEFVDELPTTHIGKIDKEALKSRSTETSQEA
ncbi:MAG: class I adenylate-forming enzyme family protein [Halobacteriales archaeon]